MFLKLARKSLLDRKGSVLLSLLAMTVSVFVLLGVEHIRQQTKDSFSNTVSGVDLIVGARTGSLNLLLYSVFKIGSPTNNIHWETYETIKNNPQVKWALPISLGDSHKGYRVLGTNKAYFEHFQYGKKRELKLKQGNVFENIFDVVLGAEVADKLGYQLGDKIVLAHGVAATSFSLHDDRPFTVSGILAPTGTPVDQTLHVSLQGIEAIHMDWQHGVKQHHHTHDKKFHIEDLQPESITAIMVGLKSKIATFRVQRAINEYTKEPLLAILPGVALSELWQMMGILEKTLLLVSALVFLAACLGVSAMLLSSIRERRHEIQLLRMIGAPAYFVFLLVQMEALFIALISCVAAVLLLWISLVFLGNYLIASFGIVIEANLLNTNSLVIISTVICVSIAISVIPSINAYHQAKKA